MTLRCSCHLTILVKPLKQPKKETRTLSRTRGRGLTRLQGPKTSEDRADRQHHRRVGGTLDGLGAAAYDCLCRFLRVYF